MTMAKRNRAEKTGEKAFAHGIIPLGFLSTLTAFHYTPACGSTKRAIKQLQLRILEKRAAFSLNVPGPIEFRETTSIWTFYGPVTVDFKTK